MPKTPDGPEPEPEPEPRFLVVGPGGTGKTTLGKFLSLQDCPSLSKYKESYNVEQYTRSDDPTSLILVAPGQDHRLLTSWSELQGPIASGQISGIIFVASYGYHSMTVSYKTHRVYDETRPTDFLNDYLEFRRGEEIEVLKQLAPHVVSAPHPMWLLTAVTKEDLWWPECDTVEQYYREGPFAEATKSLFGNRGKIHFRTETEFVSLVINNFVTGRGEPLKETAAGYDFNRQSESLVRLLTAIDSLTQWEEENAKSK